METLVFNNYYNSLYIRLKNKLKINGLLKKFDRFYNLEIKFKNGKKNSHSCFDRIFFSHNFSVIFKF